MIKGIGCDIVHIPRIEKALEKWGQKFLERIFTPLERAQAMERGILYNAYLAKRFAAKEALSKAIRTGIRKSFDFLDCEVLNNNYGAPYFRFTKNPTIVDPTKLYIANIAFDVHLSLSDEREYAQAFVMLCG